MHNSGLSVKLKENGVACGNKPMKVREGSSVNDLIYNLKLNKNDVEAVFINFRIQPFETVLKEGDRVALVPPGGVPNHVRMYVGAKPNRD